MPVILKLALVVSVTVAVTLAARELLRRKLSAREIEHAEKIVPFLLGTISASYGLIAGFMLSNSWADLKSLHGTITAEVNVLADLGRLARNLPAPQSQELEAGVKHYMQTVVSVELPMMVQGRTNPETSHALDQLWQLLGQQQPQTQWQASLHGVALNKLVQLSELRRVRIIASRERMPAIMWWILLSGGLLVVAGACIASLQYQRPAGLFLGALTAILTLVLFVIMALDQPFRFDLATRPREFQVIWDMLQAQEPR